jgi:hypothetical protein
MWRVINATSGRMATKGKMDIAPQLFGLEI